MKTYAPSDTNRCAVARPMPLLPPVMTATFPSNLLMIYLLFDFLSAAWYFCTIRYRCHGGWMVAVIVPIGIETASNRAWDATNPQGGWGVRAPSISTEPW